MIELNYLFFSILIFAFNIVLILGLIQIAPYVGLIDKPGGRKTHLFSTPVVGGFAIYLTLIMAITLLQDWESEFAKIIVWASILIIFGILDDVKNIPWLLRICVQIFTVIGAMYSTDIRINSLGNYPIIGNLELGYLSYVFTGFAIVCITNAFNLIDGIDGLCASITLVPILFLLSLIYFYSGEINFYMLIISGSIMIFMAFNLSTKENYKIFLGDAGSTTLGFILSLTVIASAHNEVLSIKPPMALWLFFIPIADMIFVIIMRIKDKKSIFQPSNNHIHNLLMLRGHSNRNTLTIIFFISIIGTIFGFLLNTQPDIISLLLFFSFLILIFIFLRRLQFLFS